MGQQGLGLGLEFWVEACGSGLGFRVLDHHS